MGTLATSTRAKDDRRMDGHPRPRGAARALGGQARRPRAGVRRDHGGDRRRPRVGARLLPADPRRHRERDVVDPHQPVRLPARRDRGAVRRALLAKAAEGVAVRVVVDRVGSRPGRSGGFYDRLRAGGIDVRVVRAPGRIDHRKLFVVDGRVALGRRRGDRGPLRRRPLPRPVRPPHGPGRRAAAARVPRQLPLARRHRRAGAARRALPRSSSRARSRRRRCTTRPARTGRSRPRSRSCSTARGRRSTSSTPTSPTRR